MQRIRGRIAVKKKLPAHRIMGGTRNSGDGPLHLRGCSSVALCPANLDVSTLVVELNSHLLNVFVLPVFAGSLLELLNNISGVGKNYELLRSDSLSLL